MTNAVTADSKCLTRKQIQKIQIDLDVYLDEPKNVKRCTSQQYGIWDGNELYVTDIMSDGPFFSEAELREKISSHLSARAFMKRVDVQ